MKALPKKFDILAIEEKWQKKWEEMAVYRFDWNDKERPTFSIDTPPPYPSGDFHMGNVLNWTYFDIVARFKRMCGYNVLFPQGWDCHGLPTEVETEEKYGIKKTDVPPAEFRKLCESFVRKYIDLMKKAIIRLGCSIDWRLEYQTMDPDYWKKTQLSFIILYDKGYIYRGTHPVNWCPRCSTAIADAEVEYESREGRLHYIRFRMKGGGSIPIATTRPELIPACVAVAVHPDDERYSKYVGRTVEVPLVGREAPVIEDEAVDPEGAGERQRWATNMPTDRSGRRIEQDAEPPRLLHQPAVERPQLRSSQESGRQQMRIDPPKTAPGQSSRLDQR